jgi:hypothetical protein
VSPSISPDYIVEEITAYGIKKLKFGWTTDSAGRIAMQTSKSYVGEIVRLVTIPGTSGDTPTAAYDVTLLDGDGTDALMGAGADRSQTNTEQVLATSLGCVVGSKLTLHVDAAGDTNKGTVIVYIRGQAI